MAPAATVATTTDVQLGHESSASNISPWPKSTKPLRPTSLDTPLEEIRRRYEVDGYVWIKGLFPVTDVWEAREMYFQNLVSTGLIKKGTDPRDGIFCGGDWRRWAVGSTRGSLLKGDLSADYQQRVTEAHAAPWYMQFANHPVLRAFIKKFTGWEDTTLLKRSLFRPNVRGADATGVHYDQIFLRGGPPTALTAWVPLGDCAINGGGLMYLEDSVTIAEDIERQFAEAARDFTDEERISAFNANMSAGGFLDTNLHRFSKIWGRSWLAADYEAGDVVFHKAFNIHASAVNETDVIRLATDLRFVETGKPFDVRWTAHWKPDDNL